MQFFCRCSNIHISFCSNSNDYWVYKRFTRSISKHYDGNNTREKTCYTDGLTEERSSILDGARDSFERIRKFLIVDQLYSKCRVDFSGSYTISSSCISKSGGYCYVPNPFLGAYPYGEKGNARDTSSKEIKEPIIEFFFFMLMVTLTINHWIRETALLTLLLKSFVNTVCWKMKKRGCD